MADTPQFLEQPQGNGIGVVFSPGKDLIGYQGVKPTHFSEDSLNYVKEFLTINPPPYTVGQLLNAESYHRVFDVDSSLLTISSDVEETLYEATVPGGTLRTQGAVQLLLMGSLTNNSGAGRTLELKVTYGSTLMYEHVTASLASAANARRFRIDLVLFATGTSTSQRFYANVYLGAPGPPTTGQGALNVAGEVFAIAGTASENSALSKTLNLTTQASASDVSYNRVYAVLAKIGH